MRDISSLFRKRSGINGILVVVLLLICASCNQAAAPDEATDETSVTDTTGFDTERVLSLDITKTIAGSGQIKKAKAYFTVKGNDTSGFRCNFSEWNGDSNLYFAAAFSPKMTYAQQQKQFIKILAAASTDFNLKALNTVGIGRLITTGDLAIKVSSEFYAIKFNEELNAFLAHSALADDINFMLKPYGVKVDKVVTEQQVFLLQQEAFKYSVIETDPKLMTEEVIDAIVYLKLVRI